MYEPRHGFDLIDVLYPIGYVCFSVGGFGTGGIDVFGGGSGGGQPYVPTAAPTKQEGGLVSSPAPAPSTSPSVGTSAKPSLGSLSPSSPYFQGMSQQGLESYVASELGLAPNVSAPSIPTTTPSSRGTQVNPYLANVTESEWGRDPSNPLRSPYQGMSNEQIKALGVGGYTPELGVPTGFTIEQGFTYSGVGRTQGAPSVAPGTTLDQYIRERAGSLSTPDVQKKIYADTYKLTGKVTPEAVSEYMGGQWTKQKSGAVEFVGASGEVLTKTDKKSGMVLATRGGVISESEAKEGTAIDQAKASSPLTLTLMLDALRIAYENSKSSDKSLQTTAGGVLAGAGYVNAAASLGSYIDHGKIVNTTPIEQAREVMEVFLKGVQAKKGSINVLKAAIDKAMEEKLTPEEVLISWKYQTIADAIRGKNAQTVLESWEAKPDTAIEGPTAYTQWQEKDGKWDWQTTDAEGKPFQSGEIQRPIWFIADSPNDRNILIVDKSYLADKNDKVTQNWITFSEFADAVASGRVGRPSDIHNAEVEGAKGALNAKEYINFLAKSEDEQNTYIAQLNKDMNSADEKVKNEAIRVYGTIKNASDIAQALEKYPDGKGGYDWDKATYALGRKWEKDSVEQRYKDEMNQWEASGRIGEKPKSPQYTDDYVYGDSPVYQSEISGQVLGSGQTIAVSSPYWADKPNLSANDFKETRFTVKNILENGQPVLALTIDFMDNGDKVIEGTSRTYRLDSNEANSALQFVRDSYSQGVVRDVVTPTQQVTPPVIPPVGAQAITPPVVSENVTENAGPFAKFIGKDVYAFGLVLKSGDLKPLEQFGVTVKDGDFKAEGEVGRVYNVGTELKEISWKSGDGNNYTVMYDKTHEMPIWFKVNDGSLVINSQATPFEKERWYGGIQRSNEFTIITDVLNGKRIPYLVNSAQEYNQDTSPDKQYYVPFTRLGYSAINNGSVIYSSDINPSQKMPARVDDLVTINNGVMSLNNKTPNKLTVVEFVQDDANCGICKVQRGYVDTLLQKWGYNNPNLEIVTFNINHDANALKIYNELMDTLPANLRGTPNNYIFYSGEYQSRVTGQDLDGLESIIQKYDKAKAVQPQPTPISSGGDISQYKWMPSTVVGLVDIVNNGVDKPYLRLKDASTLPNKLTIISITQDKDEYYPQQSAYLNQLIQDKIGNNNPRFQVYEVNADTDLDARAISRVTEMPSTPYNLVFYGDKYIGGLGSLLGEGEDSKALDRYIADYGITKYTGLDTGTTITPITPPIAEIPTPIAPSAPIANKIATDNVTADTLDLSLKGTGFEKVFIPKGAEFVGVGWVNIDGKSIPTHVGIKYNGDNYVISDYMPQFNIGYQVCSGGICHNEQKTPTDVLEAIMSGKLKPEVNKPEDFSHYNIVDKSAPIVTPSTPTQAGGGFDLFGLFKSWTEPTVKVEVPSENVTLPSPSFTPIVMPTDNLTANQPIPINPLQSTTLGVKSYDPYSKEDKYNVKFNPPASEIEEARKIRPVVILKSSPPSCHECGPALDRFIADAAKYTGVNFYVVTSGDTSHADNPDLQKYFDTGTKSYPYTVKYIPGEKEAKTFGGYDHYLTSDLVKYNVTIATTPTVPPPPTPPSQTTLPLPPQKVAFTPLPTGTNPEPYIKAMVSTSQFIKWFGGDKDWQSKVDAIVSKNTEDGKVDYSKAYSDIVAEKVPLFPPTVQYVPKTTPVVQPEPYVPAKVWSNVGEAKDQMYRLMNEVALRENVGQLTPEDKKFKEIVQWFAANPDTRTQAISYTSVMERASKDIGNWYVTNQPKPISVPLPVVSTDRGMPPWGQINIRAERVDILELAKQEMTADFNAAKQREAFDKALWNSLTPEDKARLKPEVTTTEYDRRIIANWEDPKKFISSTKQAGVDPRNYYGLAIEMGKEQVLINKAEQAVIMGEAYRKGESVVMPPTISPFQIKLGPTIQQQSVLIQPAIIAYDKVKANPKDPSITPQDLVYHDIIKIAYTNTLKQLNVNQAYELIMNSPYPITIKKEGEGRDLSRAGAEVPIDQYPTLTPTDRVTTMAGPQIPSVARLFLGDTTPEQWIGKGEIKPTVPEVVVGKYEMKPTPLVELGPYEGQVHLIKPKLLELSSDEKWGGIIPSKTSQDRLNKYVLGVEDGQIVYDVTKIITDLNSSIGGYDGKANDIRATFKEPNKILEYIRPDNFVPIQNIGSMTEEDWSRYGVRDGLEYFYLHSGKASQYKQLIEAYDRYAMPINPDYKPHDLSRFKDSDFITDPQISHGIVFDYDLGKQLDISESKKGWLGYQEEFYPAATEQLQRQIGKVDFDMDIPVMLDSRGLGTITYRDMLIGASIIQNNPINVVALLMDTKPTEVGQIEGIISQHEKNVEENPFSKWVSEHQETIGKDIEGLGDDAKTYTGSLRKAGFDDIKAEELGAYYSAAKQAGYQAYDGAIGLAGMVSGLYSFVFGTLPVAAGRTTIDLTTGRPSEATKEVLTLAKDLMLFPLSFYSGQAKNVRTGRYGKMGGEILGLTYMSRYSPENIPRWGKAGISNAITGVSNKDLGFQGRLGNTNVDPAKLPSNLQIELMRDAWRTYIMELAKDQGYEVKTITDEYGKVRYEIGNRISQGTPINQAIKNAVINTVKSTDQYGRPIDVGGRRDVVIVNPEGTFEYRLSPEQRLGSGVVTHHLTTNPALLEQLKDKGRITIQSPGESWGGIFHSPARDVQFMNRNPEYPGPKGLYGINFVHSVRDYWEMPSEYFKLLEEGDYRGAAELQHKLNQEGKLPEGFTHAFKGWKGMPEDELWSADGFDYFADTISPEMRAMRPWYANMVKDSPTASTLMESPYTIKGGTGTLKEGDWKPEYWVFSRRAIEDRIGLPTTAERYAQKWLGVLTSIRKQLPWNVDWFPTVEYNPALRGEGQPSRLPKMKARPITSGTFKDDVQITLPDGRQTIVSRYGQQMPKGWSDNTFRGRQLVRDVGPKEKVEVPYEMKPWVSVYLVDRKNGVLYMPRRRGEPYEDRVYSDWSYMLQQFPPAELQKMGNTFENQARYIANILANVEGDKITALGPYLGKIRICSLPGARTFVIELKDGEVPNAKPSPIYEIIDIKPWRTKDPNDKMIVSPATYEQLKGISVAMPDLGINMNNVQMFRGSRKFNIDPILDTLDTGFADRVRTKTQLSEQEITKQGLQRADVRSALEKTLAPVQLTAPTTMPLIQSVGELVGVLHINPANIFNSVTLDKMGRVQDRKFIGDVIGGKGSLKLTFVGDLHGTFKNLFRDLNDNGKVIEGNPNDLNSWHWVGGNRIVSQLGDIRDRGKYAREIELTLNRLKDEAKTQGGDVIRVLGNHDLAYLRGEKIYTIKYTKAGYEKARQEILDDINKGYVTPAASVYGMLLTHAGVSLSKFPEWKGKSADEIVADINNRFYNGLQKGNLWDDKIFHISKEEKGKVPYKTYDEGGIFWMRPKEVKNDEYMWLDDNGNPYSQIMGHTPDPQGRIQHLYTDQNGVSRIIMVDVGRQYWTEELPQKGKKKIGDIKAGGVLQMEINANVPTTPTITPTKPISIGKLPKPPKVKVPSRAKTAEELFDEKYGRYREGRLPVSLKEELSRVRVKPEERATGERVVGERTEGERATGERAIGERGIGERGVGERGAEERGVGERGIGERGVGERGAGERGVGERGVGERGEQRRDERTERGRETPYGQITRIPPTRLPPRIVAPRVPPKPPIVRFEEAKKKLGDNIGIIAWKQGFIYKLLYKPYSQEDILNTRKPIEGVEYHTGIRSAYDSIIRRGGYVPPIIRRSMGIYDIEISTMKDQRKPELRFRREKSKVYKGKRRVVKMPQTRLLRF
jgi:hypothetical protein